MKAKYLFLVCLPFIFIEAFGQNIRYLTGEIEIEEDSGRESITIGEEDSSFKRNLKLMGIEYNSNNQFVLFDERRYYCCEDYLCPLRKMAITDAKFIHIDGQCQLFIQLPFIVNVSDYEVLSKKTMKEVPPEYVFNRIKSYSGRYGSVLSHEVDEYKKMLYYYPKDSAVAIFNADFLFRYPLDMREKTHENKYSHTKVICIMKYGYELFMYFTLTEEAIVNFDKYLSDLKHTIWFKD